MLGVYREEYCGCDTTLCQHDNRRIFHRTDTCPPVKVQILMYSAIGTAAHDYGPGREAVLGRRKDC